MQSRAVGERLTVHRATIRYRNRSKVCAAVEGRQADSLYAAVESHRFDFAAAQEVVGDGLHLVTDGYSFDVGSRNAAIAAQIDGVPNECFDIGATFENIIIFYGLNVLWNSK